MRWFRRGGVDRAEQDAEKARARFKALQERVRQSMAQGQWNRVDKDMLAIVQLLRQSKDHLWISQMGLAELHGRWGLTLEAEQRYEEALKHLSLTEHLLEMEHTEAVAWGEGENITIRGEGAAPDPALMLEVLNTLADNMVRLGRPGTGRLLRKIVQVADAAGDEGAKWEARRRLAAFTAGMADWEALYELGRELGHLAQAQRNLPRLLDALRLLSESFIGQQQWSQALEVQRLIVDVARHLDHPSLADEERQLATLQEAQRRG